jgi:hypothetical protein
MKINFIAHRHVIERLVGEGTMPRGGAICMISSVAGLGWEQQMKLLTDFLSTASYEEADAWVQSHDTDTYTFSKQVMNCYRDATKTPHLTPEQMGNTMVCLNRDAASGLSGTNILVDTGHVMSSLTGSFEPDQQLIGALLGTG